MQETHPQRPLITIWFWWSTLYWSTEAGKRLLLFQNALPEKKSLAFSFYWRYLVELMGRDFCIMCVLRAYTATYTYHWCSVSKLHPWMSNKTCIQYIRHLLTCCTYFNLKFYKGNTKLSKMKIDLSKYRSQIGKLGKIKHYSRLGKMWIVHFTVRRRKLNNIQAHSQS